MGKELTPAQRDFISQHLIGKSKRQQAKTTEEYLEYDRRRKKVADAVATLEADHPQVKTLKEQLRNAEEKAAGGNFKGAYADLNSVKKAAKGAAKGYVAGLSVGDLRLEITAAERDIEEIVRPMELARIAMNKVIQQVKASPKCGDARDMETAFAMRRDLTQQEAQWRGTVANGQSMVEAAAKKAGEMKPKETLTLLANRATAMQQQGDAKQKQAAEALTQPLIALNGRATVKGSFFTPASIRDAFTRQVVEFEDELAPRKDISMFQGARDQPQANPAGQRFAHIEAEEKERLGKAQDRYTAALRGDAMLQAGPTLGQRSQPQHPPRKQPASFSGDDVLGHFVQDVEDGLIDDGMIDRAKQETETNLKNFMAGQKPNSDKLFDLMVKSRAELEQDIADSMGVGAERSPARQKLITALANTIADTVQANSPNKASDDLSTIQMNGKTYKVDPNANKDGVPGKIGSGGLGDIYRYLDDQGNKVIVKSLKGGKDLTQAQQEKLVAGLSPEDAAAQLEGRQAEIEEKRVSNRKEMAKEMRMHRQISGGADGAPHPNVLPMKGVAVGKNDQLLMLMDEAEGGDVKQFSNSMNELSRAGVIPRSARTAMTQRAMQQAVRGLKEVHAQDALHLDVKMQNYLMDANGNVMIADFGSAQTVDAQGEVESGKSFTTGSYAPPKFGAQMKREEEVFWLGSMLQSMSSDIQDTGSVAMAGAFTGNMTRAQTKHQEGTETVINRQTGLDRLRNAMLEEDPAKRPSLDAVLFSSYLGDVDQSYTEEDVEALMKAAATYNKAVGREVSEITDKMNSSRAKILKAEKATPANASTEAKLRRDALIKTETATLATLQGQLDEINARPAVAPLLKEIEKAGAAFH